MAGRPVENTGHDAAAHREAARRWYQKLSASQRRDYAARRDQDKQREADKRRYQGDQKARDSANAASKDPEKVQARKTAQEAVPLASACERCGARTNLERHHPDHRYPTRVVTLCSRCNSRAEATYKGVRSD